MDTADIIKIIDIALASLAGLFGLIMIFKGKSGGWFCVGLAALIFSVLTGMDYIWHKKGIAGLWVIKGHPVLTYLKQCGTSFFLFIFSCSTGNLTKI